MSGKNSASLSDLKFMDDASKSNKSGSATVGGDVVKKQETEIYIRPDGKKVRRIKKTIVRAKSSDGAGGDLAAMQNSVTQSKLSSMMESVDSKPKANASATVDGSGPSRGVNATKSFTEGSVFVRPDGKKVRRVAKKTAAGDLATPKAAKKPTFKQPDSSSLAAVLNSPSSSNGTKKSGANTIGGDKVAEGEIYIRPDGKKVRRVKKSKPKADAKPAAASLADKLGESTPTKSGSATISGGTPSSAGEVYINKDGKKVRRVLKKTTSSSAAAPGSGASLNLMAQHTGENVTNKKSGSASVGAAPQRKIPARATSYSEGEVYVRPDGKKVRRVKKSTQAASSKPMSLQEKDQALSSMLDQPAASGAKAGSASVAGNAQNNVSEIYINAEGKKVRRVRKTVPKTKDSGASLGGHLNTKDGGPSGAATVSGQPQEGEIYIRADGKKVRRVRKAKEQPKTTTKTIAISKPKSKDGASITSKTKSKKSDGTSITSKTKSKKRSDDSSIASKTKGKKKSSDDGSVTSTTSKNKFKKKKSSDDASVGSTTSKNKFKKKKKSSDDGSVTSTTSKNKFKKKKSDDGSITSTTSKNKFKKKKSSDNGSVTSSASKNKFKKKKSPDDGSVTSTSSKNQFKSSKESPVDAAVTAAKEEEGEDDDVIMLNIAKPQSLPQVEAAAAARETTGLAKSELVVPEPGKAELGNVLAAPETVEPTKLDSMASEPAKTDLGKSSLDGFLGTKKKSRKKTSGSATVTGAPDKTKKKKKKLKDDDEESATAPTIEELKTGKKKKKAKDDSSTIGGTKKKKKGSTLDGFLDNKRVSRKSNSGAASVSGDQVADGNVSKIDLMAEFKRLREERRLKSEPAVDEAHNQSVQDKASAEESVYPKLALDEIEDQVVEAKHADEPVQSQSILQGDAGKTESVDDVDEDVAGKYRQMKHMGLSDDAVKHKMVQDSVDEKVISSVLGLDAIAAAPSPSNQQLPSDEQPPASERQTLRSVPLTNEEEAIASKYGKMRQMGLPDDAVRHKMHQDDVESKIVAAVMGENWEESSSGEKEKSGFPSASAAPSSETPGSESLPSGISGSLSPQEDAIANSYRKMMRMGLPDDAVHHKMVQDGVDTKIIAAVVPNLHTEPASVASEEAAFSGEGLTHAGVSATGTMAETSPSKETDPAQPQESKVIKLSPEDSAVAEKYQKMRKMGLPDDAIRHKMEQDGVEGRVAAAVFGEEYHESPRQAVDGASALSTSSSISLSTEEEAIAEKYRKMSRMGLPEDAIRHKMSQDEVERKIVAAVMGDPWPQSPSSEPAEASRIDLSSEEESIAEKYTKMTKMGLPADAVRHKMTQDGVSPKIIAAVFNEPWSEVSTSTPIQGNASEPRPEEPVPAPSPSSSPQPGQLSAEEEDVASGYRKMKKMGMPDDAVRHKMSQDGVDAKIVAAVFDEALPEGPIDESKRYTLSMDGPKPEDAISSERFEVALDHGERSKSGKKKYETKFMSLDDIARLSGQSREALDQLIKDKKKNSEKIPKFVLQPLEEDAPSEDMFEVEVPQTRNGGDGGEGLSAKPELKNVDSKKMHEVKDGQEVVGSDLANAARAVSALGQKDMLGLLAQLQQGDTGALIKKLQKLEKQLAQAGIAIAEDIDYEEANKKVAEIAKRMGEIGGSDVTHPDKDMQNKLREEYFKLEQEMERYSTALKLTEEYQAEQDRMERMWEESNAPANEEALRKIRRHMPVKIRNMSEAELTNTPSPNGKFLPKTTAKKFKRTNILQLLRMNPDDIERMHPASLEGTRVTGLTLTERRAIYAHLKPIGPKWDKNKAEAMTKRKWEWFKMLKLNFKETLAPYQRHIEQYGPPENHPYATRENPDVGCPLIGKQCPIKADKLIDYDGDYGWTPEAEYEVSNITKSDTDDPGAKAMQEALELAREKKANERADLLKKHYKGKLLQVSKANGSCEAMDETMDKMEYALGRWIEFIIEKGPDELEADKKKELANFTDTLNDIKLGIMDYCKRSGMQTSGKKKAGGDGPDIRSAVECGLAEEVYQHSQEFFKFIRDRLKELEMRDARVEKTIELLENMLKDLHEKNVETMDKLGAKLEKSRKLKTVAETRKDVEKKMKPKEEEAPEAAEEVRAGPGPAGPPGGGGRGGLMDALKAGRGRGRGGEGGRGGLLDAIQGGRGRGRGGRGGRGGGRGDLLSAISSKGGRGSGGDGADGGRGGLLSAIQGRGKGGAAGGGGRGGLLAAIQAKGGG